MKKLSFYLLAVVIVANLAACASDNGCSMEGQWKVKTAEVSSEKLDSSIVGLAKEMMLKTTYKFTLDSVTIITGAQSGVFNGSYTVDPAGTSLSWNTVGGPNSTAYNDVMKIVDCGRNEVTFIKRTPLDTTQAALTTATITIVRAD